MASTSCNDLAAQLLACCLKGERWPDDLLRQLVTPACADSLFRIVVEQLADLFEPRLCDTYADLFSEVIAGAVPELHAAELRARYDRIRWPRRFHGDAGHVENVFVLSRITLGADAAITSVLLDAARQRFPDARTWLVGSQKSWELFAAKRQVAHAPVSYRRAGSIRDRLAAWHELKRMLAAPHSIVLDPDSRLTQLGLLPICPEENYYFFESRAFEAESDDPLPQLASRWAGQTLGIEGAAPWIAPKAAESIKIPGRPLVTMSFGVGDNPAKRIADPFEAEIVGHLARHAHVLIDEGAGGEEAERVARAVAKSGAPPKRVHTCRGSFAAFASAIARSDLYVGYDSAGQHIAAASGVPLVSIFAGYPSSRFFSRWKPWGNGKIEVVKVEPEAPPLQVLARTVESLARVLG
ncbi:MAG TPA: glycosyltransferase family 9 protein [Bryobacteraceae bacterium]|nr:glycosyltransferase family 9 protein [Bryobacteraceae bacterium]